MKRALVLILALLYLTASSGVAVNVHWCMGKQAGSTFAFADNEHQPCKRCGMKKGKRAGCCHDEHKIVKAASDQEQAAKILLQLSAQYAVVAPATVHYDSPVQFASLSALPAPAHGPPLPADVPIYLRVRSIRI